MNNYKLGSARQLQTQPNCLSCGKLLDGITGIDQDELPDAGSIAVCIYCGHIMAFTNDLTLRELTSEEIHDIAGDERILAIQRARRRMDE